LLERVALTRVDLRGLPSFAASDKEKDPRYEWFAQNYGKRCWELDAMDPNDLRARIEDAIKAQIEPVVWKRCATVERAEKQSLRTVLDAWKAAKR
jgi:hypothetical protein